MSTPASVARHPLHPILIPLPIGLWVFSFVADLVYLAGWGGPTWKAAAWYTIGGGIVGALLAAVPGLIDFFSIRDRRAGQVALRHLLCVGTALVLLVISFVLRFRDPLGGGPVAVSALGVIALAFGGWLGGELVFVHGMGVNPPARR